MNVRDAIMANPVCCLPGDSAQSVARMMCERNVGSIPVVADRPGIQRFVADYRSTIRQAS